MKRINFIKTLTKLTGLGLITGFYAWQIEPFWLEFVEKKMLIKNLPEHLVGKTLMQISDIHVGNRFDYRYLIDSFEKAIKFKPDYVVYTGDYISYESEEQIIHLKEVMKSAVKGKYGTIGILGNHDYGHKWKQKAIAEKVVDIFRQNKIDILRNQQKDIAGLNFIGFDDYWGPSFNPIKVTKLYDNTKANIVLCHNPDVCDLDIWNGYKGWILSGHTHGGQFKLPFMNPLVLPVKNKKYTYGEIDLHDGRILYINRALGNLWQIRFNMRPEITIFKLLS